MRITIIPSDKTIGIDGEFLLKIEQDFSWIPENVHAVQWYDTWGEVEYADGSPNERIEELGLYEQAIVDFNNEIQRIEDKQKAQEEAIEASRDYWEELRDLRNQRLTQSDWTQVYDAPLTELQKTAWQTYRQQLRDLPENITEPKPLVLDSNHPSWPILP
jgi:hypothetical protein